MRMQSCKTMLSQKLFVLLTSLLLLTVFNLLHSTAMLHLLLSSSVIFMITALLNLLIPFYNINSFKGGVLRHL